jgi:hypothetical protein
MVHVCVTCDEIFVISISWVLTLTRGATIVGAKAVPVPFIK